MKMMIKEYPTHPSLRSDSIQKSGSKLDCLNFVGQSCGHEIKNSHLNRPLHFSKVLIFNDVPSVPITRRFSALLSSAAFVKLKDPVITV
jgi:hypothetical protein